MEAIISRTAEEETELISKKKELAELERQQQEGGFKKYLPWIIGGVIILVLVIVIAYLLGRNKNKK